MAQRKLFHTNLSTRGSHGEAYLPQRLDLAFSMADTLKSDNARQTGGRFASKGQKNFWKAAARQVLKDNGSTGETMDKGTRKSMKSFYYRQNRKANGLSAG